MRTSLELTIFHLPENDSQRKLLERGEDTYALSPLCSNVNAVILIDDISGDAKSSQIREYPLSKNLLNF